MSGGMLGGYRVLEQIGKGGMATIYKAYDAATERFVALKTIPPQFADNPEFRTRFEQEARAIARLEHLHILPVFAYGEEQGVAYMAMRYMNTGTLADVMQDRQLPLPEVGRLLTQIAAALDYAHQHAIIHRDVKPSNILVDADHNTYLTDFGIAKMIGNHPKLTGTGLLIGTPQYMAPEQFENGHDATPASDQYALAIIVYEMITGRTPYQAETPWAIIAMYQRGEPLLLPRQLRPDLPEAAETVLLKGLAREPSERYASCSEFALAFVQAVQEQPAHTHTQPAITQANTDAPTQKQYMSVANYVPDDTTRPYTPPTPPRFGRWTMALAMLSVLIVAGIAIIMLSSRVPAPASVPQPTIDAAASFAAALAHPPQSGMWYQACGANALCLITYEGGTQTTETIVSDLPAPVGLGVFSPDGAHIVFTLTTTPTNGFYVVQRDGSGLQFMERPGENLTMPQWSPDGEWLAFHVSGKLMLIRPDNSDARLLRDDAGNYLPLSWSPDGTWLLVARLDRNETPITRQLLRYVLATDEWHLLAEDRFESDRPCSVYVGTLLSPDGLSILYVDNACRTYRMSVTDPGKAELAGIAYEALPHWWGAFHYPRWGRAPA